MASPEEEQKEHVLLEFEDGWLPPSNSRFTLSGLHTLNPMLELEDGTKMVGHYEDTVGTCILFSENDEEQQDRKTRKRELPVETNTLFVRSFSTDSPSKGMQIEPVCSLQKKLKFWILENDQPGKKD